MSGEFKRVALLIAVLVPALQAVPAAAAEEPRTFAPTGQWSVTSDGESCLLARQFGGAEDGVTLGLQAFSPGATSYNAIVRGAPLPHREGGALDFEFRFNPDTEALPTTGVLSGGNTPRLTFSTSLEAPSVFEARRDGALIPVMIDSEREAAIDELVLTFSRGRPLALQLGSMAEPLMRLRECTAGLPEKWGLDAAVQRSLSRRPVPVDIGTWLGPGSYPWEYLRNARSARIYLRLMTDEQGGVNQCVVQSPRGENIAGAVACREIVKTAKFEPALDTQSNPVPGYYTTMIFFYTPRSNGPLHGTSRTQGF
jgi:hypothetical protein